MIFSFFLKSDTLDSFEYFYIISKIEVIGGKRFKEVHNNNCPFCFNEINRRQPLPRKENAGHFFVVYVKDHVLGMASVILLG